MARRNVQVELAPWLGALRRHAELPPRLTLQLIDEARRSGVVWLRWTRLPTPDRDRGRDMLRAYEALELLALLARVDYAAWRRAIARVWPGAAARWTAALYPSAFQLGVTVHVTRGGQLSKWAERAFMPNLRFDDVHEDYCADRQVLEMVLPRDEQRVEVPVRFVLEDAGNEREMDNFTLLLFEAVQLAMTQAARDAGRALPLHRTPSLFRLVEVQVKPTTTTLFEVDVMYFGELSAYGVRVPEPRLSSLVFASKNHVQFAIASLQRMIAAPHANGCVPAERVVVNLEASRQTLDGFFSAILVSKTLRELVITPEDQSGVMEADVEEDQNDAEEDRAENRARLMQWLAVSVFSPFGCPALEKLTLNLSQLEPADFTVFECTVREVDAFSALFLRGVREGSGGGFIFAQASTVRLMHPDRHDLTESKLTTVSFDVPLERLRVVSWDDQWVSVLLPGWGQAWVPRSGTTLTRLPEEETAMSKTTNSIHHLVLESNKEQTVLDLLRVIGVGIKALTIKWEKNRAPLTGSWLPAVCRACPDVEEFYVEGVKVQSLEALVRCYEDGTCHAKRLVLDIADIEPKVNDLSKLVNALAVQNHAVARHLRELTFKIRMPEQSIHLFLFDLTILMMLSRNAVLWSVDLVVRLEGRLQDRRGVIKELQDTSDAVYEPYNHKKIAFQAAPLRLDKKVAFLSALWGTSAPSVSARCRMDTSLVGTIFEFAAECKERRAQVTFE